MSKYLIKQVKVLGEDLVDIAIENGKFSEISKNIADSGFDSKNIITAGSKSAKVALPGFVDQIGRAHV